MLSLFTTASNVLRRRHTQGIALPCLGFCTQIYIFDKVLTSFLYSACTPYIFEVNVASRELKLPWLFHCIFTVR